MDRIRPYSKHPTRFVSRFTEDKYGCRLAECTHRATATWLAGNFSVHWIAWEGNNMRSDYPNGIPLETQSGFIP